MSVAASLCWDTTQASPPRPVRRGVGFNSGKPKVEDRWVSEAHNQYTYYVPVMEPYRSDAMDRIPDAHVMVVPTSVALANGLDPSVTLSLDPKQPPRVTEGCQTDPLVTGVKSDTKKAREAALAAAKAAREARRRELMKASNSRFLANSAFTRLYKKAAFHNYGTGNKEPLQETNYMATFSINPLLHPVSDKGKTLLKQPRKQVADTAVIHAHYDTQKYSQDAEGRRSPSPSKRLLIQEREDKLRSEVSLAAKETRTQHKVRGKAPIPAKRHTGIQPPTLPTDDMFAATSRRTSISDPTPVRSADTARIGASHASQPPLMPPTSPLFVQASQALDARVQRMEHRRRGYDSSSVRHHLTWEDEKVDIPTAPVAKGHAVGAAERGDQSSMSASSSSVTVLPDMIPVVLKSFEVKQFPGYDPRGYKHLPPSWTSIIRPAGVPTGGSIAYPYTGADMRAMNPNIVPSLVPVTHRDNVAATMDLYD